MRTFLLQRNDGAYVTVELERGRALLVFTCRDRAGRFLTNIDESDRFAVVRLGRDGFTELLEQLDEVTEVSVDHPLSDSVLDDVEITCTGDTFVGGVTAIPRTV